jgi:hypothetical protein
VADLATLISPELPEYLGASLDVAVVDFRHGVSNGILAGARKARDGVFRELECPLRRHEAC